MGTYSRGGWKGPGGERERVAKISWVRDEDAGIKTRLGRREKAIKDESREEKSGGRDEGTAGWLQNRAEKREG